MSMMVSFCAVLFSPRGVLDEILNLIESVSEGFPSYFLLIGPLKYGIYKPRVVEHPIKNRVRLRRS